MHGTGNDFILFDNRSMGLKDEEISVLAQKACQRNFGVGSDGLIALEFDDSKEADLLMVFKNPDGSNAGMCGNGARCFAGYAATLGAPESFTFRVHSNIYKAEAAGSRAIIHFPLVTHVEELLIEKEPILSVYTNTEHIVCSSPPDELENIPVLMEKGHFYRNHECFLPKGTNVNFISGIGKHHLSLQTYERGVEGLTYSCGTGAIASALAWHHLQQEDSGSYLYKVDVKGGTLAIRFSFDKDTHKFNHISLEGPISFVYEGFFFL